MDSSSEGSFAWTDASESSDSSALTTDNETMAKTNESINQSGEESESGRSYKKKLQQQLFSGASGSSEETTADPTDLHSRKRKLSQHHLTADNIICSPKKKQVKAEPESDADIPKKKKKKSLDLKIQAPPNDLYDESFLNCKVETEECFAVPSPVKAKKNKKKSIISGLNETCMSNGDMEQPGMQSLSDSKGLSNSQLSFEDSGTAGSCAEEESYNECIIKKAKKKKNKSKKHSSSSKVDDMQNGNEEYSIQADETTVTEHQTSMSAEELSDGPARTNWNHGNQSNITTDKQSKNDPKTSSNKNANLNHSDVQINSKSLLAKRKSRMSERIQFEEDDSDVQTKNNNSKTSTKSSDSNKLTSFIEESITLRPLRMNLPSALILTNDDDVWVIRCPKDVKLEAFQDKKWVLDSKCKIKLDGQTYEGDIGDTNGKMTILSSKGDSTAIKNIKINGSIRLRRKLPKAHIHEDNIMVNNLTNFIPLPDTKCRHPLFGLNYKKAIKLPSSVAERLRATRAGVMERPPANRADTSAALTGKMKKKKRDRVKPDDIELESLKTERTRGAPGARAAEQLALSIITHKKKKKKRKHSDTAEDESVPHPKKAKRDIESAEVWDSEKAIEENLFNF